MSAMLQLRLNACCMGRDILRRDWRKLGFHANGLLRALNQFSGATRL